MRRYISLKHNLLTSIKYGKLILPIVFFLNFLSVDGTPYALKGARTV